MQLHSDFSKRAVIFPEQYQFVASPLAGVSRMMLDRAGGEVARATSIVRYAAGSGYSSHTHDGGEEILVLEGVFSDEHGDYPAGTYLRNPPGTSHQPFSRNGCSLLVKLWQFSADDQQQLVIDTHAQQWRPGLVSGLSVLPLHEHDGVSTALVRWAPHTHFNPHIHVGGEEILVLEGLFCDERGQYPAGSWLRSPRYSQHAPFTGAEGALIYVKVGHLGAGLLGDKFITTEPAPDDY
ncbi:MULTISPECIES: cupin domain-containing protein [unclassified Arsukibacterium]|uniref:cupin domain-containing protein n=1 Tax=unclassified Arsukibacterium TaxID=2635278 RepID=UPI000C3F7C93|nr:MULTISPECIES: cupin domain-containing protein [unclassified Arsukibacterium]MAA93639.1 cupin [Rheinheimera sp.]MBM33164.1 cupin [Rheinheimera sp.]HAW93792.1 cupin [Candidatus Azambacteria bacterium]|tara:strand:+ start:63511 stop:64221 length:711 start_codon:yes stop_codon:yes gene_type:complete